MELKQVMALDGFIIFMNIIRILTLVMCVGIIIYLYTEIEMVKLLMSDPCRICMNKTGCQCFCFTP